MSEEKFKKEYSKLNTKQKEAVDAIEGPVMVIAGPGSGKTQILSMRVGNILKQTDSLPSNILCLTFTESAAMNMRDRLANLIGRDAYKVAINTFHSFGVDIINRYPEYFYNNATLLPADDIVQIEVITSLLEQTDHDNHLKKEHPEQGYTYLEPIRQSISHLKKAGFSPEEFRLMLEENSESLKEINPWIDSLFREKLSKGKVSEIKKAIEDLRDKAKGKKMPIAIYKPLEESVADSLEQAMQQAAVEEKTSPVSKWKERWTKKNDKGERVFKDTDSMEKLFSLADFYANYSDDMYAKGYIDFDDMILNVIHAVESNATLRNNLQEQYQYILVDEFQDTNDAQIRLLNAIADNPVNEGKPNLMVVGDDDQAIYKFQGAELSNILTFKDLYSDPVVVTLTDNYRSTQDILDVAKFVISKGEDRLEQRLPDIEKSLIASNKDLREGQIVHQVFPSRSHEYSFVAKEIAKKIKEEGVDPLEIAVIARKHKHLKELLVYLYQEGVPVRYERQQNVLRESHIIQLIQMAKFVSSLSRKDTLEADELLPEILSYPFWNLERSVIWKISVQASRSDSLWLEVMKDHDMDEVRNIADFFIDLSVRSLHEPLEFILDYLIGSHVPLKRESEDEDGSDELRSGKISGGVMQSPFKDYYFSKKNLEENRDQYLTFLSSLRVFMDSVREHKQGVSLGISDLVEFVDLHEKNDIPVVDSSPFVASDSAVQLLTAHKSKGLEFEVVFTLSCVDDVWAPKKRGSRISFPANMPISPLADNLDDHLRLFYVALTRAKRYLYMTAYQVGEGGKESMPVQFLAAESVDKDYPKAVWKVIEDKKHPPDPVSPATTEVLSASEFSRHSGPFSHDEKALLKSLVEDYKMSVTHLNNFVNVAKGGPNYFLEQNLLRFPQAKTASGAFGTAVHKALEIVHIYLRKHEKLPKEDMVLNWFSDALKKERLPKNERQIQERRGEKALSIFYERKKGHFSPSQMAELNFKNQGVVIGEAVMSGKIDRLEVIDNKEAIVYDYKTGKAKTSWKGSDPYEKIQLHKFRQQLIIYKILVEESRDYGQYSVNRGVLEFVEPKGGKIIDLPLDINEEDVSRTRSLVEAVYSKIVSLDFPDVEGYRQDEKGILEFEEDLISGSV